MMRTIIKIRWFSIPSASSSAQAKLLNSTVVHSPLGLVAEDARRRSGRRECTYSDGHCVLVIFYIAMAKDQNGTEIVPNIDFLSGTTWYASDIICTARDWSSIQITSTNHLNIILRTPDAEHLVQSTCKDLGNKKLFYGTLYLYGYVLWSSIDNPGNHQWYTASLSLVHSI